MEGILSVTLIIEGAIIFLGFIGALIWVLSSKNRRKEYYVCPECGYRHSSNHLPQIYVCPQCKKETPVNEFR